MTQSSAPCNLLNFCLASITLVAACAASNADTSAASPLAPRVPPQPPIMAGRPLPRSGELWDYSQPASDELTSTKFIVIGAVGESLKLNRGIT